MPFASFSALVRSSRGAILLTALALASGGYYALGGSSASAPALTVMPADIMTTVAVSGTVVAAHTANLGFAATGRVLALYAQVGQKVAAGALLAEVENGDLAAALAEKKADLDALVAGTRPEALAVDEAAVAGDESALIEALRSAYTTADDALHNKTDAFFTNPRTDPVPVFTGTDAALTDAVEAERAALEPMLAKWQRSLAVLSSANAKDEAVAALAQTAQVARYLADLNALLNQAVASQTASAATLASYATTLASARAAVDASAATLSADAAALTSSETALELARAGATAEDLRAAKAAVDAAAAALSKTLVIAPFAGVVTRMDVKVGEIVSPSTSEISLQSDGLFQVEAYVPEVSVANVRAGEDATTTLDAYGAAVAFPLRVISVDPAETLKNGVPAYKTTLTFLAPDGRVRSGMTANVVIGAGVLHNAIVLPLGAVGYAQGAPYVSVSSGTRVERRSVVLGEAPALGQVEIVSGLVAGDRFLLTPR